MAGFQNLVTVIVLFVVFSPNNNRATEYCVTEKSESCSQVPVCAKNCHSLMYYVNYNNWYSNISDGTTFMFLPGDHMLVNSTLIANVSGLILTSYDSEARVICNNFSGGLSFFNITNLTIDGLNILDCSTPSHKFVRNVHVALEITFVHNLVISALEIHNTSGYGLLLSNVAGNSLIADTTVESSHSWSHCHKGSLCYGGNLALYWSNDNKAGEYSILITDSHFLNGTNTGDASGVFIHILHQTNLNVTINNCRMAGNSGYKGGNVGVMFVGYSNLQSANVIIQSCNISSGYTYNVGGGLYATAAFDHNSQSNNSVVIEVPILAIKSTRFENNVSPHVGAAVFLRLHENNTPTTGLVSFTNCSFESNTLHLPDNETVGHGGVAVHIIVFRLPPYSKHITPLYKAEFINCTFSQNEITPYLNELSRTGVLFVQDIQSIVLNNSTFVNNTCTGIIAIQSNLMLKGSNLIQNHTGTRGGGMVFCAGSKMHLYAGTLLTITQNNVSQYGGGIFVEDDCSQVVPYCFYQVDVNTWNTTTVSLTDNNATYAGSALFGGLIDNCLFYESDLNYISKQIFNSTFHISGETNGISTVSSNPLTTCFCLNGTFDKNNCSRNVSIHVVPGENFNIPAILVGQHYGPVPGVVNTVLVCTGSCRISTDQQTQTLCSNQFQCPSLHYIVFSSENTTVTLQLVVEDSYFQYSSYTDQTSEVLVHVQHCPLGFVSQDQSCACNFPSKYIKCNIANKTITREPPVWIGLPPWSTKQTSDIIFHHFCPLSYCLNQNVTINTSISTFDQDAQCAQQRTGLLCGKCRPHHSLGFGSSECHVCPQQHTHLRIIGLIILCATAGVLLVLLLTLLNLTVSDGVLNGLIFYANIIQVNKDIFFPPDSRIHPLATFIAWMNLDFGVNVCFYHGMDTYGKTWLQFLFPFYLWFLSAAVIYFSRKSKLVSKLAGKNAVKVLATLLLLSFGKLLRVIITAVSLTIVKYQKRNRVVWLPDANLEYLKGHHISLFVFACIACVTTLFYAFTLTFIQCLRRAPNGRLFSLIRRLKPFFDAYTGPYKDNYHFWTGFLLLIRVFLFICFAVNVESSPDINLTLIAVVCSALMIAIQPGVYRHLLLGILESSMYVNLAMFSTITMFLMTDTVVSRKVAVVYVFIGSALLIFLCLVVFHGYKQLFGYPNCGRLKIWCLEKARSPNTTPIEPLVIYNHDAMDTDVSEENEEIEPLLDITCSVEASSELREPLIENTH